MGDHENPKVLRAFHRGVARGVDGSTQGAVEVLVQGFVVIGLMTLAHLTLGIDWSQPFVGGGGFFGIGFAVRKIFGGNDK